MIDFRKRRFETKKALVRKVTPRRNFERLLVYSNRPKLRLETSLKRLETVKRNCSGKKAKRAEDEMERSLARELLPALRETVEWMYNCMASNRKSEGRKEKDAKKTRNIRVNVTAVKNY